MAKAKAKNLGGHPTKYKQEYCAMLVEHMKEGYSFESFGAIADCCKDTLYEWCKVHKRFSDAKRLGRSYSLICYEKIGKKLMKGDYKGNASVFIFTMKNMHGWRDDPMPDDDDQELEFV